MGVLVVISREDAKKVGQSTAHRWCAVKHLRKDRTLLNPIVRKFQYGQHTVTLETGMMARQATAAVMVSMDDTAVFVTVVGQKKLNQVRTSSR